MRLVLALAALASIAGCRGGPGADPVACGGAGQICCAASPTCSGELVCTGGTCRPPPPCGAQGQACCSNGSACGASLDCVAGSCQPCGASGQACCSSGAACVDGLGCENSTCLNPCSLDKAGVTWLAFTHVSGGNYDIDLVHADGTCRLHAISSPAADNFPVFNPTSADLLAFSTSRTGTPSLYAHSLANGTDDGIPILDLSATAPTWSPDGLWIAFEGKVAAASRTDVYRVPRIGGIATALTAAPGNNAGPVYSPDGTTLYFVSNRSGTYQVYSMPSTGGLGIPVSGTSDIQGRPAISPDGALLAFARINGSSVAEVAVKDLASGAVRVVSSQGDSDPAFDATGTRLAVASTRGGDIAIWLIDTADGGNPVRVTTPAAGDVDGQPAFRP